MDGWVAIVSGGVDKIRPGRHWFRQFELPAQGPSRRLSLELLAFNVSIFTPSLLNKAPLHSSLFDDSFQ